MAQSKASRVRRNAGELDFADVLRLSCFEDPRHVASQVHSTGHSLYIYPAEGCFDYEVVERSSRELASGLAIGRDVARRSIALAALTLSQQEMLLRKSARGRLIIDQIGEPRRAGGAVRVCAPYTPFPIHLQDVYAAKAVLRHLGAEMPPIRSATERLYTVSERTDADRVFRKLVWMLRLTHHLEDAAWIGASSGESCESVAKRFWVFVAPARSYLRNERDVNTSGPSAMLHLRKALDQAAIRDDPSLRFMNALLRSTFAPVACADPRTMPRMSFRQFIASTVAGSPLRALPASDAAWFDWEQRFPEKRAEGLVRLKKVRRDPMASR